MWIFIGDVPIWFPDNDDDGGDFEPPGPIMCWIMAAMIVGGIAFSAYLWWC